jgi:lactoylglutathione lyase
MRITIQRLFLFTAFLFTSHILIAQTGTAKTKASLNHIALYVVDLKKSSFFYQDIIGLDTIPEPFHDGKHTWFSIGPKSHLHVIQGANAPIFHEKQNHLCFTVPSVDEFIKNLDKQKVEYEDLNGTKNTITKRVDGVKQIYFKDPDGYWIEVNDARQ